MPMYELRPSPPRLHWGWVLALNALTFSLFSMVWLVVQANWVRKVRGRSTAFPLSIVHASILPIFLCVGFVGGMLDWSDSALNMLTTVVRLALFVLWIATVFTLCDELTNSPIEIPLGGVMTFFFGPIYFQFHLHDYELGDGGGPAANRIVGLGLSQPNS
jgi:hypothetical protein